MPKTISKCIFCATGTADDLTGQHVIPKALHNVIPRTVTRYRKLQAVEHHTHSTYRTSGRGGDPRDWKVICVCEGCNNGWMRDFETECQPVLLPILRGEANRITEAQQSMIAGWAAMQSIVAEYDIPEEASTHHMQRKYVMRHLRPPKSTWAIWIGYVPRKVWTPTYAHYPFHSTTLEALRRKVARTGSDVTTHYNGKTWSQVLGQMLIHVINAPMPGFIRGWRFPPLPEEGALVRIWPPTGISIVWPTDWLSDRDTRAAMLAFRNLLSGIAAQRRAKGGLPG